MLVLNLSGECFQFRFGTRYKDKVKSFLSELKGEFFAQAIRSSGDNSPGTWLAIFAELLKYKSRSQTGWFVTYGCAAEDK